jgi:hypothetical protein
MLVLGGSAPDSSILVKQGERLLKAGRISVFC